MGSTKLVHTRLATEAMEWQTSIEADLKREQRLLQAGASRPDGPAAQVVRKAADRINKHQQNGMNVRRILFINDRVRVQGLTRRVLLCSSLTVTVL